MELFKIIGKLVIEGAEQAQTDLDNTSNKASSFGEKFGKVAKVAGAAGTAILGAATAIGGAVVAISATTVSAASDVEEMENKFNVVFQGMTDEVDDWANNYANAIGRNSNVIKGYLADNQNMFVGMGMTRDEAAGLSENLVSLALDLASFNNLSEDDAVNAMSKALMGETESAKQLGAVLNDNTRALAMEQLGYEGKFDALTEAQKMEVNYQAILNQSADAVGDCERSLDSYKGRQIQLNSSIAKVKETIGAAIMPILAKLMGMVQDKIMPAIMNMIETLLPSITSAFEALMPAIENLIPPLIDVAEQILPILVETFTQIMPILMNLITQLLPVIAQLIISLVPVLLQIVQAIMPVLEQLLPIIVDCIAQLLPLIEPLLELLMTIIEPLLEILEAILPPLTDILGAVLPICIEVLAALIETLKEAFTDAWDNIKSAWEGAGEFFSGIWNGIKNAFGAVGSWFKETFTKAWQGVKDVFSTGGKIFDGIKDGIANVFKTVVNGIIGGINKVISVPFKAINTMLKKIRDISIVGVKPFTWIKEFDVPEIPKLYKGGVLEKGQTGYLEGNGAEAVVPLENNKKWIHALAKDMDSEFSGIGNNAVLKKLDELIKAIMSLKLYLNGDVLVGELAPAMDAALGTISMASMRGQ